MNENSFSFDIIDAINQAAIVSESDLKGTITFANQKFCAISGYSQNELLGKNHNLLRSHVHPNAFFKELWKTILSGRNWHGEICNRAKNGELYWVNTTIIPIFDELSGQPIKYVGIRFDITEQKRLEATLKQQKENYESVMTTTDGFCRVNLDGKFIELSDSYCQLTGYKSEELLYENIAEFGVAISESDEDIFTQIQYALKHGGKTFETLHKCKNDSLLPVEIMAAYHENSDYFLVFLRDITERKNKEREQLTLQQQLNHLQRLESIGRLTSGIAHDFNNILASILGYTELNKMLTEEISEQELQLDITNNLEQVEIAGNRAADLIEKMLTYCRQHDETKIKNPLELKTVLTKVLKMLNEIIPKTILIKSNLVPDLTAVIDESEIYQVIINLFVNARDAIENRGEITLTLQQSVLKDVRQCSACHQYLSGEFVEISVTDTGAGIKTEKLPKIFDPFFTTKEVGKGTGLGLSVVSGIIHKAGGHVLVESEIGCGTTFRLFFGQSKLLIDKL